MRLCAPNTFFLFSSRKGAEAQRNCGLIDLTSGGLSGFAALRAKYFFSFFVSQRRRGAKNLWSDWFDFRRPWRLYGFARQILFLFFTLAKAQRRKGIIPNSLRLPYFAAWPAELRGDLFFFSSKAHHGGQNKPILICIINFQMSQRWNYSTMIEYVTIRKLMFFLKV